MPNAAMLAIFSVFQDWYDTGKTEPNSRVLISMAVAGALVACLTLLLAGEVTRRLRFGPSSIWRHIAGWAGANIVILDIAYGVGTLLAFAFAPSTGFTLPQTLLLPLLLMAVYLLMIAPFAVASGILMGTLTYGMRSAIFGWSVGGGLRNSGASDWAA